MAKLYALTQIIMPDDTVVQRKTVFDATPLQAKQFDKLKAARPATAAEIDEAKTERAIEEGSRFPDPEPTSKAPVSTAPGDPNGKPKGKSD